MGVAVRGRTLSAEPSGVDRPDQIARQGDNVGRDVDPLDYWRSEQGLCNITPRGKAWPEGDGFADFLTDIVGSHSVLEFGCGIGRLSGCFDQKRYVGVDVSPHALQCARSEHPGYEFWLTTETFPLPPSEVTLAHTVLLHVSDQALRATVARFESKRVIISEILGRHWRRSGNPPVFNREAEDYVQALAPRYWPTKHILWPYPHYQNTNLSVLEFVKV